MVLKKFKRKSAEDKKAARKMSRKKSSETQMDAPVSDFIVHVYDNLLDSSV